MSAFQWTPELIDHMLSLLDGGLSTAQVARQMGITKNSIIGKAHRERVKRGLPAAIRPPKRRPSLTDIKPRRKKVQLSLALDSAVRVSPIVTVPEPAPDLGQLASIVDVTGCRFHVRDDADFVGGVAFCNHDQKEGSSYCAYHARKAVMPYKPKPIEGTLAPLGLRFPRRAA
jgi:hypothetical protein